MTQGQQSQHVTRENQRNEKKKYTPSSSKVAETAGAENSPCFCTKRRFAECFGSVTLIFKAHLYIDIFSFYKYTIFI